MVQNTQPHKVVSRTLNSANNIYYLKSSRFPPIVSILKSIRIYSPVFVLSFYTSDSLAGTSSTSVKQFDVISISELRCLCMPITDSVITSGNSVAFSSKERSERAMSGYDESTFQWCQHFSSKPQRCANLSLKADLVLINNSYWLNPIYSLAVAVFSLLLYTLPNRV